MYLPHTNNVRGQGNRVSCAANVSKLDACASQNKYIDKIFGHSWDFTPSEGAAVYGATDNFEPSPIDKFSSGEFLRVPYRRIPVIDVNSPGELESISSQIISMDKNIHLLWRGQVKQYFIKRDIIESQLLYGVDTVLEPSLVPSASRSNIEFSEVFPVWAAVLDLYLVKCRKNGVAIEGELANFKSNYNYRLWAFATAQHYGLPSVGLDVTTDLWTAVFFALNKFDSNDLGATTITKADKCEVPILYAMGGFTNDIFDDRNLSPSWLQCGRPIAQSAHFLGTGWGVSSNKAAERIVIAFRLLNHDKWVTPKNANDLFPNQDDDSFLRFLLETREKYPEIANEAMLERVYFIDK